MYSFSANSVKVLLQLILRVMGRTTLKSKKSMDKHMVKVSISLPGIKNMFYYTVLVVSWQHGGTMEHQEMGSTVGHTDHGSTPQNTQLESYTLIVGENNVSAVTKRTPRLIIRQKKSDFFSVKHVQIQRFQVTWLKWCSLMKTERLWNKGNNLQVKIKFTKVFTAVHMAPAKADDTLKCDGQTDGRKVTLVYACTIIKNGEKHKKQFILHQVTDKNHKKFSFCKYNITPSRTRYFT